MTTITFEKPVKLPRTHFRDLEDLFIVARIGGNTSQKNKKTVLNGFIRGTSSRHDEAKKFFTQWAGAFSTPSREEQSADPRLEYLTKKHLR